MVQSMKTVESAHPRDRCQTLRLVTVAVYQWLRRSKRRRPLSQHPGTGVVSVGILFYSLIMVTLAVREIVSYAHVVRPLTRTRAKEFLLLVQTKAKHTD